MVILWQRLCTVTFFWVVQLSVAVWACFRINLNSHLFHGLIALKIGVSIAKAGAAIVNLNAALLMLSMSRAILTRISQTRAGRFFTVGWLIPLHRYSGIMFLVGCILHCAAHVVNLILLSSRMSITFLHPTLIIGMILVIIYGLVAVTAYFDGIKRHCYELFYYTHYLAPLSIALLYIHGMFCFLKDDRGKCTGSATLFWVGIPAFIYLVDQVWSICRANRFSYISKVIEHPSNVVEVQIRKPSFRFLPGQYLYLKFPQVSRFQWHPFTLTSAPEEDHLSLHIRIEGNWTRSLWSLLQSQTTLERIKVFVDGPYGCSSQDHGKYTAVICIGAGIGQTPFASILKSLWFRLNRPTGGAHFSVIHFVGICRSTKSFEWFNDILVALERSEDNQGSLHSHLYVTGLVDKEEQDIIAAHHQLSLPDPITGLESETQFGRPKLDVLFGEWQRQLVGARVGVFYCGPKSLGYEIERLCKTFSTQVTLFEYQEEAF